MTAFKRHINRMDLAAIIFLGIIFAVSLGSSLAGLARTELFAILTGVVLIALMWLILMPVSYLFTDKELIIHGPWPLPDKHLPYDKIIDIDGVGSYFSFRMDADAVEIILTWKTTGDVKSKRTSCHPTHAREFVQMLDGHCTNLVPKRPKTSEKKDLISVLRDEKQ